MKVLQMTKELLIWMLRNKLREVNKIDTFNTLEDIVEYSNNDEKGCYETSQEFTGFKNLFREIIVKDWKGTDLQCSKHRK